MRRRQWIAGSLFITVLSFACLVVYAADQGKPSDEFRKQFIEDFHRTGLNTTPGDAMFLRILVEASGAKRGVEIGAASGYGAINMGIAFERTGGHLYTLEIDPRMAKQTRENVATMGLQDIVTCIEGDALQTLPTIEGPVDFVFIDALKSDYFKYFKLLEPKLAPHAVVVADNVIQSARAMKDYLDFVQTSPDYDTVIIRASLEKNDGMAVSYKIH
jgi:caffeoyl-CoA O-methyltransferase